MQASRASLPSFCASLPVLILASACTPRLRRRLRPTLSVPSVRSLNEPFVSEALASRPTNEAIEPRQGVVLHVTFVQPERKLVNIAIKMLRAGMVIDANQTALENGEDTFDAVRGDVVTHIFASAVIDRFVCKAGDVQSIPRRAGEDVAVRLHARMLRVPDRARCKSALGPVELLILREVATRSPARSRAGGVHLQRVRRHIREDFRGLAAVVVTDAWAFARDDARTPRRALVGDQAPSPPPSSNCSTGGG